jgi:hypothetical protein
MEENHKNEFTTLNNLYEDLTQKYDNIKHFQQIEVNLKNDLENYKNNLENEKKQRIK